MSFHGWFRNHSDGVPRGFHGSEEIHILSASRLDSKGRRPEQLKKRLGKFHGSLPSNCRRHLWHFIGRLEYSRGESPKSDTFLTHYWLFGRNLGDVGFAVRDNDQTPLFSQFQPKCPASSMQNQRRNFNIRDVEVAGSNPVIPTDLK